MSFKSLENEKLGYGIFALAFISVFREGIETILFLYSVMMKQGGLNITLSLVGGVLGVSLGYMIFVQGKNVPLKTFFNVSSVLLIFVAGLMILEWGVEAPKSFRSLKSIGNMCKLNTYRIYVLFSENLIGPSFSSVRFCTPCSNPLLND